MSDDAADWPGGGPVKCHACGCVRTWFHETDTFDRGWQTTTVCTAHAAWEAALAQLADQLQVRLDAAEAVYQCRVQAAAAARQGAQACAQRAFTVAAAPLQGRLDAARGDPAPIRRPSS